MMKKHLIGMCHLAGVLFLSACGGGDPEVSSASLETPQQAATASPSLTALGVAPAGEFVSPRWNDQITRIYEDRYAIPDAVLLERQFEISTSGEAFMGWQRTHKMASGAIDGTAVHATRYDAATQSWITDQVALVPFPRAGGGHVFTLQMMSLPQGDMLMLWDVVNAERFRAFTAPQVYFSRYSAQQRRWSTPQRMAESYGSAPGQWGVYGAGQGWKAYPAGQGRVLLLRESMGQLYAHFYTASTGRWLEPENVGTRIGFMTPGWSADDSRVAFNQGGSGVVRIDWRRALYFDGASQQWSAPNIIPGDFSGRTEWLVDDAGDVLLANSRFSTSADGRTRSMIDLHKWSRTTSQRQRLIEMETDALSKLSLFRRPGGVVLVWNPVLTQGPGVASVNDNGELVERLQIPTEDSSSISYAYVMADWDADDQGRVTFVWRSCRSDTGCSGSFSRTYTPGHGLSPTVPMLAPPDAYYYSPLLSGYASFKSNAQGQGALFIRQFDEYLRLPPGDHSLVQVHAKVFR